MTKQIIPVELDDETIGCLAALGNPAEVLARLAGSAADGVRRPGRKRRAETDKSLRGEREKTDVVIARESETVEDTTDDALRIARQRADQIAQTARDEADDERHPQSTATEASSQRRRIREADLLENERSNADAGLKQERAERRRGSNELLTDERQATDKDLLGERAHADSLIVNQRKANEQMVNATIRAQDLTVEADAARAHAEQVAEFREMFIGMLGHDLRNPLGSIVMSAGLLLRRSHLNEHDAETVTRIIRGSQRMTRMITQLLDLTRARLGGGLPIEAQPTDLREVCRDIVEEFEATVQLKIEGDVTGMWDQDRLAEVLSNLTGNAIEHAAPKTVVTVKAYADEEAVVVEISNQGDPIPAEVLPFIFEPFRRARQHQKSAAGNLGLGLYIARQIVLSHGGTLDAHSADGTTTFAIRLPRRPPAVTRT